MCKTEISIEQLKKDLNLFQNQPLILRKLLAIEKYMNNQAIDDIARQDEQKVTSRTIYNWIRRYREGGCEALIDKPFIKSTKLNSSQNKKMQADLLQNPLWQGRKLSIWNAQLLLEYIAEHFQIKVSLPYCQKVLSNSESMYKSSHYFKDPDSLGTFESEVKRLIKDTTDVILFFDSICVEGLVNSASKAASGKFRVLITATYEENKCKIAHQTYENQSDFLANARVFLCRRIKHYATQERGVLIFVRWSKPNWQIVNACYNAWNFSKNKAALQYKFKAMLFPKNKEPRFAKGSSVQRVPIALNRISSAVAQRVRDLEIPKVDLRTARAICSRVINSAIMKQ